jgi:hypothetical protein
MLFRKGHPATQHGIQPNAIFNVYAEIRVPIVRDSRRCFTIRRRQHDKSGSGLYRATSSTSRVRPDLNRTLGHFLWQRLSLV